MLDCKEIEKDMVIQMKKIISMFCAAAMTAALSSNTNVLADGNDKRKRWTNEEVALLHLLNQYHYSIDDITRIINERFHTDRTIKACKEKLQFPLYRRFWSEEENDRLVKTILSLSCDEISHDIQWGKLALMFPGRTPRECQRQFENGAQGLKGSWSEANDELLLRHVENIGERWFVIGHFFGVSPTVARNRYHMLMRSMGHVTHGIEANDILGDVDIPSQKETLPSELDLSLIVPQ